MSSSLKNLIRRQVRSCPSESYNKSKALMLTTSKNDMHAQRKQRNALPDDFDARTANRSDYAAAKLKFLNGAR